MHLTNTNYITDVVTTNPKAAQCIQGNELRALLLHDYAFTPLRFAYIRGDYVFLLEQRQPCSASMFDSSFIVCSFHLGEEQLNTTYLSGILAMR